MALTYDPDDKVQLPDSAQMYTIELPAKKYMHCFFGSDAAWENCLCLTRYQPGPNITLQKSQYAVVPPAHPTWLPRNLDMFAVYNYGPEAQVWIVSGWHKQGRPSGSLPWIQSPKREEHPAPGLTYVRFEDSGDEDWNDIWVEIQIT